MLINLKIAIVVFKQSFEQNSLSLKQTVTMRQVLLNVFQNWLLRLQADS